MSGGSLEAQVEGRRSNRSAPGLRVFLECSTFGCDQREFRTQIGWVDWMRDRADASLHVIVTSQETGSGGRRYQLDFLGLSTLEGQ